MPKVRKAIIPAAGYGTRFLPISKAVPKEMLPLVDKPVIQYVVEEAVASGITDILIVISRSKRAIEEHFHPAFDLESELEAKGRVDVAAGEQEHQLGVLGRDDLGVAAVDGDLQAAFAQPDAGVDVLRVAQLRRGETTADEILRGLQAEALADHQGVAAAGDRRKDADLVALGADVGVDRRGRPDVGEVDRAGEEGLDGGRAGVERTPLDLGTLRQMGEMGLQRRREAFLKASIVRSSWAG